MEYGLPPAKANKPVMAVLAGPTRSFMGWAMVKTSKLSRPVRRYLILRSSYLNICTTDNPRSQIQSVLISGATFTHTPSRFECCIRSSSQRIWIQWPSESDLRVCKSVFEFANRQVDDSYKLVTHRQLGKGRNSEVVFAFDTATGDHAAVKIINKDKARSTDREFAEKEVRIRMTLQHPHIVQTLDIFESPYDLFVVMELMPGGALDRRLAKFNVPLAEWEARVIMRRLFIALEHLHMRGIAHRNVKPQNIYLDISDDVHWPDTAKLSDFSLACFLDDPDCSRQVVGTPEYLAPEAAVMTRTADGERGVVFDTEVDMWAAGVTLYNMLSLQLPFEGEYPPDVFKRARSGHISFDTGFTRVSPMSISLIRALLNVDRRKRPTAQTVMLHPWFTNDVGDGAKSLGCGDGLCFFPSRGFELPEGVARFRAAVTAVLMLVRLGHRAPRKEFRGSGMIIEKRFHFVSGVDIAPIAGGEVEQVEEAIEGRIIEIDSNVYEQKTRKDDSEWGEYVKEDTPLGGGGVLGGRTSATMMSRVSTESTVKSRSSAGTDYMPGIGGGQGIVPFRGKMKSTRETPAVDLNPVERRRRNGSMSSEGVGDVHRLLKVQTAQMNLEGGGGGGGGGGGNRLWRRWNRDS